MHLGQWWHLFALSDIWRHDKPSDEGLGIKGVYLCLCMKQAWMSL